MLMNIFDVDRSGTIGFNGQRSFFPHTPGRPADIYLQSSPVSGNTSQIGRVSSNISTGIIVARLKGRSSGLR
jgi:hypothetical protein